MQSPACRNPFDEGVIWPAGGGVGSVYDPIDSTQFTEEEMRAAVRAAADWNTYVAAHAYTSEAVRRTIDAGVKVIEHPHPIDEETMKYAVNKGIWFTYQYLVFTIDNPNLTESQKAKQRYALKNVENFFALAKKHKRETHLRHRPGHRGGYQSADQRTRHAI